MRSSPAYRVLLTGLVLMQLAVWRDFIGSSAPALGFLRLAAACWLGLTIQVAASPMHCVWTFMFGVSFSLMALSLYPLLSSVWLLHVWWSGFIVLFWALLWCAVDYERVWLPEHVAFMAYHAVFILFFWPSVS
jgi:hypothetical protein